MESYYRYVSRIPIFTLGFFPTAVRRGTLGILGTQHARARAADARIVLHRIEHTVQLNINIERIQEIFSACEISSLRRSEVSLASTSHGAFLSRSHHRRTPPACQTTNISRSWCYLDEDASDEVTISGTSTRLDGTVRSLAGRVFVRCVPVEICADGGGAMAPAMERARSRQGHDF